MCFRSEGSKYNFLEVSPTNIFQIEVKKPTNIKKKIQKNLKFQQQQNINNFHTKKKLKMLKKISKIYIFFFLSQTFKHQKKL